MTVFRKTLQLKACQASKGKNLTSSLLSCLVHLKIPFVYLENLSKIMYFMYFLHCIFSSKSIFSVLVKLR